MQSRTTFFTGMILFPLLLSSCGEGQQNIEEAAPEPIVLEGTFWQLHKITAIGGYEFVPEDGSDYVLRFRSESRLVVDSDCNTAGATWSQDGNSIILEQFVTTNGLCPPGTLHNHFVSNLRNIETFTQRGDNLVFATSIPGVTLEFAPRATSSSQ